MSGEFQRLMVGGIGGMTPVVVTLLAGEYKNVEGAGSPELYYAGLALRALLLFAIGAFFVWLNQAVRTRYATFQLGAAAPALIVAMLNSNPAESAAPVEARGAPSQATSEVVLAALEGTAQDRIISDALAPRTILFGEEECTIWDGLLGRKCKK
jgi:hypothetical protein